MMTNSRLNSTTAMVLVIGLAFPQPIPAQEQEPSSSKTGDDRILQAEDETPNAKSGLADDNTDGAAPAGDGAQSQGKDKDQDKGKGKAETKDKATKKEKAETKQRTEQKTKTKAKDKTKDKDKDKAQDKDQGLKDADKHKEQGQNRRKTKDQGARTDDRRADQGKAEDQRKQREKTTDQKQGQTGKKDARNEGGTRRDVGEKGKKVTGQQTEDGQAGQSGEQAEKATGQNQGKTAEPDTKDKKRKQPEESTGDTQQKTGKEGTQAEKDEADQVRDRLEPSDEKDPQNAQDQGTETQADQATGADRQTDDAPEVEEEQKETARRKARKDDTKDLSSEEQAEWTARTDEGSGDVAALTGGQEPVNQSRDTITQQQSRSSDEAFFTDSSGRQRRADGAKDDDDDDLLKMLGTIAAVGLGAYAVGQLLDDGGQVVANTGDRVVIEQGGHYRVIKDENILLRRPDHDIWTETFADGSTRTVVTAPDGVQTITVRSRNGRVLQRMLRYPNGEQIVLIDETRHYREVNVATLPHRHAPAYDYSAARPDDLRTALLALQTQVPDRAFSLYQIRNIDMVRYQVPVIAIDTIKFETDSAVIRPSEAEALSELGNVMRDAIEQDPGQVFLIEGHTDTVGSAAYNLALSDRRAESVALALTEYFDVPPASMVVQGYGESDLKVSKAGPVRENRRAAVRNITPLLNGG